jgi:DNA repair protein RadD
VSTIQNRTLHPHQMLGLKQLREALLSGSRSPLLGAPTAYGKTVVAVTIIRAYVMTPAKCGAKQRVILTVPAIELIDQTVKMLISEGITDIGVLQGNHPMANPNAQVQVASVQTLMNRRIPMAQCVLIDECHRWFDFYERWMAMPEWRKCKFIGMSATPWTKGLAKHFDTLCVPTTTKKLIETINPLTGRSFLSPFKVFAPDHPDLTGVGMVGDDYNKGQLGKAMLKPKLIANVVDTWLLRGRGRPSMCFAVNRAHAAALWAQFKAAGVKAAYIDGDTAYIDDEDSPTSRERIRSMSHAGLIEQVVNIGVLTTGCDWPWISCISLARPTKSEMLYVQIIGRGLRDYEGKDHCLILDHSDTTERLGFVDDLYDEMMALGLDDGKLSRSKSKPKDEEKPLPKECPSCNALKPPKTPVCPHCGFHAKVQSTVRAENGELVEIDRNRKPKKVEPTNEVKQLWYSMLLGHAASRGMKKGWAFHKYREKFGKGPGNQIREIALEPNAEVASWIRSRQIAYAKGRNAGQGARP